MPYGYLMKKSSSKKRRLPNNSVDVTGNIDPTYIGTDPGEREAVPVSYEATLERVESISGPLPSPQILSGYAELIENAPERIMQMAEKQLDHNMRMEEKGLKAGIRTAYLGQILAFIIGLILIGSGVWLTYLGHDTVGGIIFGSCLVGVVGLFAKGLINKKG